MTAQLNDVTVRDAVRYFTATVDGIRYEIPEAWSMGYCRTHGGDARDAALAWHEQAVMQAAFEAQRLTAFAVTFRNPAGRLQTWTRFARNLQHAESSAREALRAEFPNGRGGSDAMLKRIAPTADPRD